MNNKNSRWFEQVDNFIKFPRALLSEPRYQCLTGEDMIMYCLIIDRMKLSAKSETYSNENGDVFVYFTIKSIKKIFGCSDNKAVRILKNLEDAGLIIKINQGPQKPTKIIPLPIVIELDNMSTDDPESG